VQQNNREPTTTAILLKSQALIHRDEGVMFVFARGEQGTVIQV